MPRPVLLPLLLTLLGCAEAQGVEWGFSDIEHAPITLREGETLVLQSEQCAWCHREQYAQWSTSRHRMSWTNDIFQAGYIVEPQDFCVYCHAPLAEQTAEVLANKAWYLAQDPRRDPPHPAPVRQPEPYAAEGVNCVTCHWREGQLLGPTAPEGAAHPVTAAAELRDPAFCSGCHEFNMPEGHGAEMTFTDVPMQKTYREWTDWGGGQTCQGCHMPGGSHTFRGANDLEFLRAAVEVTASAEGAAAVLCVESVGVGHHLPTGDLFRRLSLQVDRGQGFETVRVFGRSFHLQADPLTGEVHKVLKEDTALRPGQPVTVTVPAGALRWRLRYHYGSEQDEALGLVARERMIVTVAEGAL